MNSVAKSLANRTLLVTGTTGFLGKVFLEKLLRLVPDIEQIYLLIRAGDLTHSLDRLENSIFASSIFDRMKTEDRDAFRQLCHEKVTFVMGDTGQARLGVSPTMYVELLTKVDAVVNVAASTDFVAPLDEAVHNNTLSVRNMHAFIKESQKARLLHVSTCYVNEWNRETALEEIAEPPHFKTLPFPRLPNGELHLEAILSSLEQAVNEVRTKHASDAAKLKKHLIELGTEVADDLGWNNIYTFTKWLGEKCLRAGSEGMHCSIVRPSIIESCLHEPVPGWIEGFKVADPLLYGGGSGMVKFLPGHKDSIIDMIPVDLVSNAMFLALGDLLNQTQPTFKIFQSCSSSTQPLKLSTLPLTVPLAFGRKPITRPFFLPSNLYFACFNTVERASKIAASAAKLFGLKSLETSLGKTIKNLGRLGLLSRLYDPYLNMQTVFDSSNLRSLHRSASAQDQLAFPVELKNFKWDQYIVEVHIPGLQRFVLAERETTSTAVKAKTRLAKAS